MKIVKYISHRGTRMKLKHIRFQHLENANGGAPSGEPGYEVDINVDLDWRQRETLSLSLQQ